MKVAISAAIGATMLVAAQPLSAMPQSFGPSTDLTGTHNVRTVCDQWGRCWEQPRSRYRQEYGYDNPYDQGDYRRPLSKWERKGFCPPGQAKKGNC